MELLLKLGQICFSALKSELSAQLMSYKNRSCLLSSWVIKLRVVCTILFSFIIGSRLHSCKKGALCYYRKWTVVCHTVNRPMNLKVRGQCRAHLSLHQLINQLLFCQQWANTDLLLPQLLHTHQVDCSSRWPIALRRQRLHRQLPLCLFSIDQLF